MDRPLLAISFEGVILGADGNITPGFFDWLENAKQYFTFTIYSPKCANDDGLVDLYGWLYLQRKTWGEVRGFSLGNRPTMPSIGFASCKPNNAFLSIDSRVMQFRGDWTAWWMDPIRLSAFKAWTDPNFDPKCEVADDSAPTSSEDG